MNQVVDGSARHKLCHNHQLAAACARAHKQQDVGVMQIEHDVHLASANLHYGLGFREREKNNKKHAH